MKTAHVTVVVLPCANPVCRETFHVGVTLLDEPFGEPSYAIPKRCTCGTRLDTPRNRAHVLDTAAHLMQAGY